MTSAPRRPEVVRGPLFVDAHAHFHRVFELPRFLSAAARNVGEAAIAGGLPEGPVGVLLLAEGRDEQAFERLQAGHSGVPDWSIESTAEPESLLVRESGRLALMAMAGRQIVTSEGVEVLALLSAEPLTDGLSLTETMAEIQRVDAVPVLPWGFGKWTLRRGSLVASLLRTGDGHVFLGDNGGRPGSAPTPSLLVEARRRSVPVLPGSDPFPFRDEQSRIAAYGFIADVTIDADRPAAGLRAWLRALDGSPPAYGRLETLGRFAWNQVRIQWRKRTGRAG